MTLPPSTRSRSPAGTGAIESRWSPLDQPHDELDASLDILSRLAATAESVEAIKKCFDLYPELQPPADAVAR
jgi:hypothetical protein